MNSLPSIVQVVSSYPPNVGGVETLAHQVARRYDGPLEVLTNRWPPQLPERETFDGVAVRRVGFPLPGGSPRSTVRWALDVRRAHRVTRAVARGADVVHVQCVGPNAAYALRAARAAGLPLVVSLHGELTMDDTGAYRLAAMRRAWRAVLGAAAVVTGCSQVVVDDAVAAYGPELASRIRVLPNAVDAAAIQAAAPASWPRPFVLAAARLVPHKGLDMLLPAFAQAAPDLDLLVAGDGPQRPRLAALARELGIERRVHLLGSLPVREVHALMRSARLFALPSRREPQGLVLLEAMAAGAPVLATDVDGVPETVRDRDTGLLVPPSVAGLTVGLRAVLQNEAATRGRVERARRSLDGRTWDAYVDALTQCYVAALSV